MAWIDPVYLADVGDLRLNCRGPIPSKPAAALDVAPLVSHRYTVSAAPRVCTSRAALVHCAAAPDVAPLVSHGYTVAAAPRVCTSRAALVHCPMRKGVVSLAFGQNCLGRRASSSYISLRIPTRIFTRARGCTPCRVGLNTDGPSFTAACLCYV